MEILAGLLGTAASGGLFGLLGSVLGFGTKWLQSRQEEKSRGKERAHEIEILRMQRAMDQKESEEELKILEMQTSNEVLTSSYQMPIAIQNVHMWVNDIRGLFRPFLTIYLNIIAFVVLLTMVGGSSDIMDDPLTSYMVHSLFFAANTATVWWFGDRALSAPKSRNL